MIHHFDCFFVSDLHRSVDNGLFEVACDAFNSNAFGEWRSLTSFNEHRLISMNIFNSLDLASLDIIIYSWVLAINCIYLYWWIYFLEIFWDSGNCSTCSWGASEAVEFVPWLFPYLGSCALVMRSEICFVVKLICEKSIFHLTCYTSCSMKVVLIISERNTRAKDRFCSIHRHIVNLFLSNARWHRHYSFVSFSSRNDCQGNSRVASCPLDYDWPWLQEPSSFCVFYHP